MPTAEIITIGTEILLGEIVDTNTCFLARALRDAGIDLYRTTTVGDNVQRIAQTIRESLVRCDLVITTGGLGPTVDDPTREAVALAVSLPEEYHPELWDQIQARFQRYGRMPTENNRKQAYIPQGAQAIENRVGTAPAFVTTKGQCIIISLPGVPREMEFLMEQDILPFLKNHFDLHQVIKARVIHTSGIGESVIDEIVSDLEKLSNPTVGLAAHSGQVDVRITAKAGSVAEAEKMILEIETLVRERMGDWIYGIDEQSLEAAALDALKERGWTLAIVESGLGGELVKKLAIDPVIFIMGEVLPNQSTQAELLQAATLCRQNRQAKVVLGVSLIPGVEKQDVFIVLITPDGEQQLSRPYGGAPGNASRWAVNHCLNVLRSL